MKKIFASASVAIATLALLVFAISFLSTPPLASADVFSEVCIDDSAANNNPNDSAVCQDKQSTGNPFTGSNGIILRVSSIIAMVAGFIAVIMIIMSGISMMTSSGDAAAVKTARSKLIHSAIGLVIIALAQTIVVLVVSNIGT